MARWLTILPVSGLCSWLLTLRSKILNVIVRVPQSSRSVYKYYKYIGINTQLRKQKLFNDFKPRNTQLKKQDYGFNLNLILYFLKITALLKCNLHTMQFSHLNSVIRLFSAYAQRGINTITTTVNFRTTSQTQKETPSSLVIIFYLPSPISKQPLL